MESAQEPKKTESGDTSVKSGKYLTFRLANENYGVEILKVQEIIGIMPVTRVPKMPEFVRGIVNLRGKLIPIIDMRSKFSLPAQEDTEKTCIIVVQVNLSSERMVIGVLVDSVSEVLNILADQIEPPPNIGMELDTDFILGVGKVAQKVVMLLDIDKVLTTEEMQQVGKTALTKK